MKTIKQSILIIVIGLALVSGISFAAGTWSNPKANPTGGNTDAPINTGSSPQAKSAELALAGLALGLYDFNYIPDNGLYVQGGSFFQGSAWFNTNAEVVGDVGIGGNVGIGTDDPGEKLEVSGKQRPQHCKLLPTPPLAMFSFLTPAETRLGKEGFPSQTMTAGGNQVVTIWKKEMSIRNAPQILHPLNLKMR